MNSKRLLEIANYVSKEDSVLDLGCDHGYLSIHLYNNKLCKKVIASDVSKNALNQAKSNFLKYKANINTYLSDGLKNIDEFFDTLIIAGMGTNTIISILNSDKRPNKIILASNNDYYLLRKHMNKLGYSLKEESVVNENNHYYVIMSYILGTETLNETIYKYGIGNNKDYYKHLYNKNEDIIKKVPLLKKLKLKKEQKILKSLIEKK